MSTSDKNEKTIQITAAQPGVYAHYEIKDGDDLRVPILVWALVERMEHDGVLTYYAHGLAESGEGFLASVELDGNFVGYVAAGDR
jgi:hypothetical protein